MFLLRFMATPAAVFSGGIPPSSVALPIRSPLLRHSPISSPQLSSNPSKGRMTFTATASLANYFVLEYEYEWEYKFDRGSREVSWWTNKVLSCRKPSSKEMISRLDIYKNLQGLDPNLIDESTQEGKLFIKLIEFKYKFPAEIFLGRVGDCYEAIGFDACIIEEYTDLNPSGSVMHNSDSFPKVVFHYEKLYQTLDDLISNGVAVCVVEEIPLPFGHVSHRMDGHVKPGGYRCSSSNDDNPVTDEQGMEEFRKHLKKLVRKLCRKVLKMQLDELWKFTKKPEDEEYLPICDSIPPDCEAPFKTAGRSYTYLMIRPNKEIFVGETDNLYVQTYNHRLEKGMNNCWFLYFLTPNMKVAWNMKVLLINRLSESGVTCTNWRDHNF